VSTTGIWTLSGADTYSGGTMISAGTLRIGSATALGNNSGAASVVSGAVLDLAGTTMTGTNGLTLAGTGISSGGALTNSSATPATYAGQVTLGSSGVSIGGTGTIALTAIGTIGGSGDNLTLQGAGGSIASILGTGTGSLTVNTTGVWQLSGANTFTGGVNLNGGTLRIGNAAALNSTTPNAVSFGGPATLDLNGYGATVSGLTGSSVNQIVTNSNTSTLGPATLTYAGATPSSFAGILQDGGSTLALNVASGALTLSGNNTYSGGTQITGGTLRVANVSSTSATGSGSVTVSGGTLAGAGGNTNPGFIGGAVSILGGGTIAPAGGGTASSSNNGTLTVGALTLNNGATSASQLNYLYNSVTPALDEIAVTGALTLPSSTAANEVQFNFFAPGSTSALQLPINNVSSPYILMTYGSLPNTFNSAVLSVNPADLNGTSAEFSIVGGDMLELNIVSANASAVWSSNGNSDYGTAANWSPHTVPNGPGLMATFGTGSQTSVSVNGAYTVGTLSFNNSSAIYTLSSTDGGSLTLNNTGTTGGATVNVSSGGVNAYLQGNLTLTLADSSLTTTFNIGSGSYLDVTGPINQSGGAQQIVLAGGGTLQLDNGTNSYSGGTTVSGGILDVTAVVAGTSTLGTGPLAINAAGTTSIANLSNSISVGGLSATVSGGGSAQLNVASGATLTVNQTGTGVFAGTLSLSAGGSGGGLTVGSGTVQLNVASATSLGTGVTATVASGATLQLTGTVSALSDPTSGNLANVLTQGTGSASDGALSVVGTTSQTVGVISGTPGSGSVTTYAGNTTVGDGTNAATLTATQILQNTLTINAGSTVTIAPSGSGIPADAVAATDAVASSEVATGTSTADGDSSSDPFTAIQAAIASGSISNAKGQQLENRIAAIERLAATDPGLDVSLLEDRVLAALPTTSVWSSSGTSPLLDSSSGLLAADSSTIGSASGSTLGGATAAFAPSVAFGGSPAAVPEPSTLLLAAIGRIGILIAIRRRTVCCE